jgi:hypothetical protein
VDGQQKPLVLVAVEPRCYREALGAALAMLRPNLDVRVLEPWEVRGEAALLHARVVLSGLESPPPRERERSAWVRIVFPAEPGTWVSVGDGPLLDRPDFDVEDLLELVDGLAGSSELGSRGTRVRRPPDEVPRTPSRPTS